MVKDNSQNMSLQKFFGFVLYLSNLGGQGPNEIGTYSPRSTCPQRLVAELVNLFFVDSVFFFIWDPENLN